MFVLLREHAANIANVLTLRVNPSVWFGVCDWLMVAASVGKVELNTSKFNQSYGYCSSADEYDDAREELLRRFVQEYSVFSFVWGALEAAISLIKPARHAVRSKRGKIRDAAYYLRHHFRDRQEIVGLSQEVGLFSTAARACLGSAAVDARLSEVGEFGGAGVGLYAVYELRNQFAHGSLEFPEPDEENRPISDHASMVAHAGRIALIQLQMLLLAHLKPIDELVAFGHELGALTEDVPLELALRSCHLARTDAHFQLPLIEDA
jgi:hypothetical protein